MKKIVHKILIAFVALLVTVSTATASNTTAHAITNNARVVSEKRQSSRVLDLSISSPSIEGWTKTVRLLVPNGWSKTSTRTWPTLWMLHGGGGNFEDWTKNTDIDAQTAGKDVIVVLPDTSWCSAYSDWYNYGKGGKPAWETFVTAEVREILETYYRADTSNRAIAGLSMGGLGSMKFAANHTGMFKSAASFSGNLDPLHAYDNMKTGPDKPGLGCLADWKRVWGDYTIPDQLAIWQRNDPYVQAEKLRNLDYIYVSSGNGTQNPLNSGINPDPIEQEVNRQAQAMVTKLQNHGISVDYHFYGGTHSWPYWQEEMHRALPGLLESIGA